MTTLNSGPFDDREANALSTPEDQFRALQLIREFLRQADARGRGSQLAEATGTGGLPPSPADRAGAVAAMPPPSAPKPTSPGPGGERRPRRYQDRFSQIADALLNVAALRDRRRAQKAAEKRYAEGKSGAVYGMPAMPGTPFQDQYRERQMQEEAIDRQTAQAEWDRMMKEGDAARQERAMELQAALAIMDPWNRGRAKTETTPTKAEEIEGIYGAVEGLAGPDAAKRVIGGMGPEAKPLHQSEIKVNEARAEAYLAQAAETRGETPGSPKDLPAGVYSALVRRMSQLMLPWWRGGAGMDEKAAYQTAFWEIGQVGSIGGELGTPRPVVGEGGAERPGSGRWDPSNPQHQKELAGLRRMMEADPKSAEEYRAQFEAYYQINIDDLPQ